MLDKDRDRQRNRDRDTNKGSDKDRNRNTNREEKTIAIIATKHTRMCKEINLDFICNNSCTF